MKGDKMDGNKDEIFSFLNDDVSDFFNKLKQNRRKGGIDFSKESKDDIFELIVREVKVELPTTKNKKREGRIRIIQQINGGLLNQTNIEECYIIYPNSTAVLETEIGNFDSSMKKELLSAWATSLFYLADNLGLDSFLEDISTVGHLIDVIKEHAVGRKRKVVIRGLLQNELSQIAMSPSICGDNFSDLSARDDENDYERLQNQYNP